MLALAGTVRSHYLRLRRLQPMLSGLPIEFQYAKERPDRVASALRAWSIERAHADLVPLPRPAEREPIPELPATVHAPWSKPAVEAPPARDHSERMPQGGAASEPAGNHARPAAETPNGAEERSMPPSGTPPAQNADHYEILQISPNADPETIHRVYRIMAARFHPDNPSTGSLERFLQLREAYQTLSDPGLRAAYDARRPAWQTETLPIFWHKSFVDGIEGEANRRLGVLSLLYQRRRISENRPGVSLMELDRRMAFPREYLNFTLWYLRSKGYITMMEDNSDYALTSAGVDYVESSSNKNRTIRELLTAGNGGEYAQPEADRKNVVPFPRNATRSRAEGSRRVPRRRQAGRR